MNYRELFDKTAFLLGAGASYESGCLISSKMLASVKRAINEITSDDPNYGKLLDGFLDLYRVLHPALAYQADLKNINAVNDGFYVPNIEDLILILRKIINRDHIIPEPLVGSWSDKLIRLQIVNPGIFESFLNFIYQSLIRWITPDDNFTKAVEVLNPIKNFLSDTIDEDYVVNFFTLNYDLTIEKALNSTEEQTVNTGFSQNQWQPNSFDVPGVRINLAKIHGSLDWYRDLDTTKSTESNEVAFNEKNPNELKPNIILGYENKLFSVDPFFTLVQRFIQKTHSASLIIVIGYSFFDPYLNNILIQTLNEDENKRLLIVDPSWSDKTPEEFSEYIKHIQSDVSSLNLHNYQTLYSSRVKIYKAASEKISGAGAFYKEYFSNRCGKLFQEHYELNALDNPF